MRNKIAFFFILFLVCSCNDFVYTERQKIFNPINSETLYLKYCFYSNSHDAIMISMDSIYKWPIDSLKDYIFSSGGGSVGIHFYKLKADTLFIYGTPNDQFKKLPIFKTKIEMIYLDVVKFDSIKRNYKKLGLMIFPLNAPLSGAVL